MELAGQLIVVWLMLTGAALAWADIVDDGLTDWLKRRRERSDAKTKR